MGTKCWIPFVAYNGDHSSTEDCDDDKKEPRQAFKGASDGSSVIICQEKAASSGVHKSAVFKSAVYKSAVYKSAMYKKGEEEGTEVADTAQTRQRWRGT